jgi:hypothetical protein
MENKYERYAEIKNQIKILSAEEDIIKKELVIDLEAGNKEFEFGKFSRSIRKTYTYSDEIKDMTDDLKEAQLDEVEQGLAKVKESPYVTYNKL